MLVVTVKLCYEIYHDRDIIDLLRHTSSTCIFGCLVFTVVNGG
jgi:hypothetical protein